MFHTAEATLDVLGPGFKQRIISGRAVSFGRLGAEFDNVGLLFVGCRQI